MVHTGVNVQTDGLLSDEAADAILGLQFIIAWAGEGGEEKRLNWWRTDLVSEFGGIDLFQRLLPNTWEWAVLQAVREAARRTDQKIAARAQVPDRTISLFNLGFEIDELLEERLQVHKRSEIRPGQALNLEVMGEPGSSWKEDRFLDWLSGFEKVEFSPSPAGRLLKREASSPEILAKALVACLAPLSDEYPRPHIRR
ncbi:BREX-6 system BrxE protein [Microvenator marinus]|uniref:BREX-6 system BrxE protein n=1 Tax=Microvenator marinus TaxID=2600177 RepID=A0A5B8XXS5_9DELT|nr:BREX-6 system BrxE protein [Microvenator marinus]QED28446.1 BREX-6 system BrxE protein [Microvenator marinus]